MSDKEFEKREAGAWADFSPQTAAASIAADAEPQARLGEESTPGQPLDGLQRIALQDKIVEALRTCYDPEIPVNIYELGLIYEVRVEPSAEAYVKMTLTSPNCPAAASLPLEVQDKIRAISGVTGAKVEIVWEPMWDPSKMSEAARLQLGIF
jgi:FeS assembly SUF system protein